MYKIKNNLSPSFLSDIFPQSQNPCELCDDNICKTENIHTVFYGSETVSFQGPKTWEIIPDNIKNSNNLNEFKAKIKSWKPERYACRICKVYVQNLGVIVRVSMCMCMCMYMCVQVCGCACTYACACVHMKKTENY